MRSALVLASVLIATLAAGVQARPIFLRSWGEDGRAIGQFNWPWGVAVGVGDVVYVADHLNHRIQRFSRQGDPIDSWGTRGDGPGEFWHPTFLAVDPGDGSVYVVDRDNFRIQKFTATGDFVLEFGEYGNEAGRFIRPWGVAVDGEGSVYVSDFYANRINKFSSRGHFQFRWGENGPLHGQFHGCGGLSVDDNDRVYVTDVYNDRIEVFTRFGEYHVTIGMQGLGDDGLLNPNDVAVHGGYVYVVNQSRSRMMRYTDSGAFIDSWGGQGPGNGRFVLPFGVAVDSFGEIYVTDFEDRVQVFGSQPVSVRSVSWGSLKRQFPSPDR